MSEAQATNVIPACRKRNFSKHAKLLSEWPDKG